MSVAPAPGGARVTWRQTATSDDPEYDIEARLRGVLASGLEGLRDAVERA